MRTVRISSKFGSISEHFGYERVIRHRAFKRSGKMANEPKRDFKNPLRRITGRYYNLVGAVLFLLGVVLRLLSIGKTGFAWLVIGDIGTFLAVAITIPFIYDRLIKTEDRQLFLSDLEDLLDAKLPSYCNQKLGVTLHEGGRRSIDEEVAFIQTAKCEVVELGIALRTFSSYFEQRASYEFKNYVMELLRHGVVFKCVAMNPDCEVAAKYAENRGETELLDRIRSSLKTLKALSDEFKQLRLPGKFEIYLYSHFPYFHPVCVDGDEANGRIFISPYMYATKGAETPGFEFLKSEHLVMFEKYWASVKKLLADSRQL